MATKKEMDAARELLMRCARACAPYREHVVVAGRMALVLYRVDNELAASAVPEQATREVDIVVPRRLAIKGASVAARLASEGLVPHDALGLDVRRRGKRKFQDKSFGTERAAPSFVEFLTPRVSNDEELHEPQFGLVASQLRYVDLLLFDPLVVPLSGVDVYVAAPSMFIAQKALMRTSDTGRREAKDLVSIYEACLLSEPRWSAEREIVTRARAENATWPKWLAKVPTLLASTFASPKADASIAVATTLRSQPRAPSAEIVTRVVADATAAVFGSAPSKRS